MIGLGLDKPAQQGTQQHAGSRLPSKAMLRCQLKHTSALTRSSQPHRVSCHLRDA